MEHKIIHWWNHRNYNTDPLISELLSDCIKSGICDWFTDDNGFKGVCVFNNGVTYTYWNRNMPYAWLREGRFTIGGTVLYDYDNVMPSKRVMNMFHDSIYKFILNKINNGERK